MQKPDRRTANNKARSSRIAVGSMSAPLSIIISWILFDIWGKPVNTELTIAISTLMGSLVSLAALCFWDLRAILLNRFYNRRFRNDPETEED